MNHLFKRIAVGSASLAIILPFVATASSQPVGAVAIADTVKGAFCSSISASLSKVSQNVSSARDKTKAARSDQAKTFTDNRTKWDQEIATARTTADQKRQENFTKLESKATTDAQKTAVKAYETAVTDAVNTRRAANDAARASFRTAVDNAVASQKANVEAQATIFASSVSTAITTAEAACVADPGNAAAIRTTLQASLKSARDTYNTARKSDTNIGDQIKKLTETRNTAIKANDAAFAAATKAARETLKAAFGTTAI